jgi:drug/metabolite transporter (DMT)-like permease
MLTGLFVISRVVSNPLSNVFQKQLAQRGANPIFIIAATHALLTLVALPIVVSIRCFDFDGFNLDRVNPDGAFWINIAICTLLAVAGNALLVAALKLTDLSVLGPVNSYKAVVSLVLGVFLLGEIPSASGAIGVFLIVAGSYFVVDRAPGQPHQNAFVLFFRDRGIQLRLAALICSATEAVFLKRAILHATPLTTFLFWSILGLPIAAAAVAFLPRGTPGRELQRLKQQGRTYVWLALTTGLMQATTLLTFGKLQLGYSLALFQLSTVISVFLGYRYFAERNIGRRLIGSLIMVAGAALIVAFGRTRGGG